MSDLRIGMIGAGWAAGEHAASLAALGEAPPVAVVDPDRGRADALAARCGAAVAADLDALLAVGLDAAIVTTPTGAHAAAVLPMLAAGVAVFVEKPLSVTVADARAVALAARRSGVPVGVAYQWRAVPALETLADELAGQDIALLATVGVGITQARPWFLDDRLSSGLIGERGSHHLDLLGHLGGPVTQVRAVAGGVRVSGADPVGATDVLTVTCTYVSGMVSSTLLVWASEEHLGEQSLRVVGNGGHYLLELDPHFRLTGRTGRRTVAATSREVPFVRQLARFLRAVRSGNQDDVFCTPAQAQLTVAVIAAASDALITGNAVTVSHP